MTENIELADVLKAARRSGIAHNNGAGGQYLLCATEQQLLKFADNLRARQAPAPVEVSRLAEWVKSSDETRRTIAQRAIDKHNDSLASTPVGEVPAGWISVKDRLPNSWQDVLCLRGKKMAVGSTHLGSASFGDGAREWFFGGKRADANPPTHWMPLPAAPGASPAPAASRGDEAENFVSRWTRVIRDMPSTYEHPASPSEPEAQKELDSVQVARLFEDFRISDEGKRSIEYLTDRSLKPHLSTVHGALFVAFRAGLHASPSPAASMEVKGQMLTTEEVAEMLMEGSRYSDEMHDFAREVQRALAAKNGWRLGEGRG